MVDAITAMKLGGVVSTPQPNSLVLLAKTYHHPLLPNIPLVTLVTEPLQTVADITLATTNFNSTTSAPVGYTQKTATGFPAWPILTDPKNAQHALNLVPGLKKYRN